MLYLVSTPIGNLDDISLRALKVLNEVDIVASEDTRKTGIFLKRLNINKSQISFHEHNEKHVSAKIIALVREGKSVAVVSDAGTPVISDPGYVLVSMAIKEGIQFTLIPGPTALIMALVLSGLPTHGFTFRGFPPRKRGPRRRFLEVDKDSPHTLIFHESPHRLRFFLDDALEVFGDREAAVANDLTKLYETIFRGTLTSLLSSLPESNLKGEYVVVIAGAGQRPAPSSERAREFDTESESDYSWRGT